MTASEVEQALGWKARRGKERIGLEFYYEVDQIRSLWATNGEVASKFSDIIPMKLVTIIEVFTREMIRELIDFGHPYLDRAERLAKGVRIDFIFASHVSSRKLSIGDIVAHSISTNNITQLISYFVTLIPDYIQKLQASHSRWSEDMHLWPLPPIIPDYDVTMSRLARLFEIRHILTHELPSKPTYEVAEVDSLISASADFVQATDWVIVQSTRGNVPRTQVEMNSQAAGELNDLAAEMEGLLIDIRNKGYTNINLLNRSQDAWTRFAERDANLHASVVEGGSMYRMIWSLAKADVTRQRIETLRRWKKREEGDV